MIKYNPTISLKPGDFIKIDKDVYEVIEIRDDEYVLKDKRNMRPVILHIDDLSNMLSNADNIQIWRYN